MDVNLEKLINSLDYIFRDKALLQKAFTHLSSDLNESYERLEFLGDRVLGLIIAEQLYKIFPKEPEGDLAKRYVELVRRESLVKVASELKLNEYIILGKSEKTSGGQYKESLLADVTEALIGAIYLDGGHDEAKAFIIKHWSHLIQEMKSPPRDPKTALQELLQGRGLPTPLYQIVSREGPDHAPIFEVSITVEKMEMLVATAPTKRVAEQRAAEKMLNLLEKKWKIK